MQRLTDLTILPGLYTVQTDRGARGRWKDGDKVRFLHGVPEKIGGWQKPSNNTFLGKCRRLFDWQALSLEKFIAFGTHLKLYAWKGGAFYDITPLRSSGTLGANPFTTTASSTSVSVRHVGHGATVGDYVTFGGAAAFNGVTIDGEYSIASITDADNYVITHSVAASGSGAGGGAAVTYAYQINIGGADSLHGYGWGAGSWSASTFGMPRTVSNFLASARVWSFDKWGEDLVACPRGGAIYLWDASTGTGTRAAVISGTPSMAKAVLVSPENQHLVVLGAHNGSANDPLLIRWSSSEDYSAFTASASNSAGSKRLTTGNEIYCGVKARKEILVFTDSNLWSMVFSGTPNWFDFQNIGQHGGLRSPNAVIEAAGVAYWMGEKDFFVYDGSIRVVPCDVHPTVFKNINDVQRIKTYGGYNRQFGEIWWFYCSANSSEIDRYVVFSIEERLWVFGTLARTAYIGNSEIFVVPFGAGADGYLYDHETGVNADGAAMTTSLKSGDIEIGDGDRLMFINAVVPDFKRLTGTVYLDISGKKFPQSSEVTSEAQLSITSSTQFVNPRVKARQVSLAFSSIAVGDDWRMGTLRIAAKPLGRK